MYVYESWTILLPVSTVCIRFREYGWLIHSLTIHLSFWPSFYFYLSYLSILFYLIFNHLCIHLSLSVHSFRHSYIIWYICLSIVFIHSSIHYSMVSSINIIFSSYPSPVSFSSSSSSSYSSCFSFVLSIACISIE